MKSLDRVIRCRSERRRRAVSLEPLVQSGRAQPHSKTFRLFVNARKSARFWSAAVLCRFAFSGISLKYVFPLIFLALLSCATTAFAADTLTWQTNQNLASADIKAGNLRKVLGQIGSVTGWRVFV